jgi:hypothetical protein
MQIAIIILIISFLGMTVMIGRKLVLLRKGHIELGANGSNILLTDIEKIKSFGQKNLKRYGYFALFSVLRSYIRTVNSLKKQGIQLAKKIENKLLKNKKGVVGENAEKREVSKYLKIISEYQEKIRKMKKKIQEEEKE